MSGTQVFADGEAFARQLSKLVDRDTATKLCGEIDALLRGKRQADVFTALVTSLAVNLQHLPPNLRTPALLGLFELVTVQLDAMRALVLRP